MIPILTSSQMHEADIAAAEKHGITSPVLMENASRGACDVLAELLGGLEGRSIAVVCGRGNNGGDGIALARHAILMGADAVCILLDSPDTLSRDAAAQYTTLASFAPECLMSWTEARDLSHDFDAVVDAMLGTGASGVLRGVYADAVTWCNTRPGTKLAIDIPTGVDADSGTAGDVAFSADATATMAALKPGLVLGRGAALSGTVYVVGLGTPTTLYEGSGLELLDIERARAALPDVDAGRNKYDRGKAIVVAGSPGMTGAAVLAAEASVRSGAGLTVLALPEAAPLPQRIAPEIMTLALRSSAEGAFAADACSGLLPGSFTAVAIGPGLSRHASAGEAVRSLVRASTLPVVLDADGISAFAHDARALAERTCPLVITPHHGEMARLLGVDRALVERDPLGIARATAAQLQCVVVLKGAPTVVATADGRGWINGAGNPGMATGGTGDVLTGVLVAMIAQHTDILGAVLAGTFLHSHAADLAAESIGVRALNASDIIAHIGAAYRSILSAHA